eukprot:s386_g31.t1
MWLPPGEAALYLLESLTGQAELETEHLQLDRVAQPDGIEYLLNELRKPLSEKTLYLKRLFLQEWETVSRQLNESIRSYVNRFRRILMDLRSQEVGLEAAFATETVGFRLLERARLSPDQMRIVLVGSNQSFEYGAIRESMVLQFPEGKAPPPLYGVSGPKGQGKGQTIPAKGGCGPGKSDGKTRLVNVAEEGEDAQDENTGNQAEEDDAQDQGDEGGSPEIDELAEQLQETLTVTSEKLKALTQARRYSTPAPSGQKPGKGKGKGSAGTSNQGKCHLCDKPGHFARDCPKKGGKGKTQPNKAMYTNDEEQENYEEEQESYFVFVNAIAAVPDVLINMTRSQSAAGHLILDTACQKLCHGASWFQAHDQLMRKYSLWSVREPTDERFKFGAGSIQQATEKVLLPCVLGSEPIVLKSCELQADIPFLGSLSLLTKLGAVIDLLQGVVHFQELGITSPIVKLANRHVAVKLLPEDWKSAQSFPVEFHTWPSATDELALQPGRSLGEKKVASPGNPQVFSMEAGEEPEAETQQQYPIEREYDFSPFGPSSYEPQPRKAWDNARQSYSPAVAMEEHGAPTGQPCGRRPPPGNEGPPAQLPRDGGSSPKHGVEASKVIPKCARAGGSGHSVCSGLSESVSPRKCDQDRQPPRKFCNMSKPGVRNPDAVQPGTGSVARILLTIATALAASFPGTGCTGNRGKDQELWWPGINGQIESISFEDEITPPGVRYDLHSERDDVGRCSRRTVPGTRRQPSGFLKEGEKKRLASQAAASAKILMIEKETLEREVSQAYEKRQQVSFGVDLLEMPRVLSKEMNTDKIPTWDKTGVTRLVTAAADQNKPTELAFQYGLKTVSPTELDNGWEQSDQKGSKRWKALIKSQKPLVVIIQYPYQKEQLSQIALWTIREQSRFEEKRPQKRRSVKCGEWDRAVTSATCRKAYYVDFTKDKVVWRQIMDQAEELFRTSTVKQITLTDGNDLHHNISELIPWEIAKIQLARAPAARRLPTNFPFSHRAGIFLHNDDSITVESEDIQNIAFPRQKFAKPVKLGIIVYGRAPDDDQPQEGPQTEVPQAEVRGEIWEYLVRAGIETDYVPAEAHHKLGKAERNNTVFREALNRTADSMAAADLTAMEEAAEACIYALNSVPRTRGMSAYACAFGKIPRMPGDLLTDENSLAVDVDEQQHRLQSMIFRAEAQKAVADVNVDMHLRRALLRKTAHMRVDDISPGAKVAVWRAQLRGRSTKKRGGYVIGKLIAWDGASAWVQIGWQTVKVDRAQMRPAYGFEGWSPSAEDIQALKDAERNFIEGDVIDGSGQPPPEDEAFVPEIADEGAVEVQPQVELLRLPEAVAQYQQSEGVQSQAPSYGPSRRGSALSIAAPSESKKPSVTEAEATQPEASEAASSSSQALKRTGQDIPTEDLQETKRVAVDAEATPQDRQLQTISEGEEQGPPRSVLELIEIQPNVFGSEEPGGDGCPPLDRKPERLVNLPEVFRSEYEAPEIGSDDDLQEQKALDREIPWREIVSRGGSYLDAFVDAADKEHRSWIEWGPVKPLTPAQAKLVLQDPKKRRRILKSRSCFRDKNVGVPPLKPKCRVVVLGHQDPDLKVISRDSPTPTRLSEMVLLTIYISGAKKRFGNSRKIWYLKAADASTAFLQGKQPEDERPGELYMLPPTDPISKSVKGAWEHPLYLIQGNVYGLSNAPRLWTQEVIRKLERAGFKSTTADKMLFEHRNPSGELTCLALVYVDDFLVTHREDYDFRVLEKMFTWGGWSTADQGFKFKGKEIKTTTENGEKVLKISQRDFIRAMQIGKITRSRTQQPPQLTPEELTEFRSCCGSLQWLVGQTRPDGASCVSLTNKGTETTVEDLKTLYKLMAYMKATEDVGITIKPIDLNMQTHVVSYGDCSWANAQGLRSQEGIVVVLSSPNCLEGQARCVMVDWKTCRTPRVVRSTIAGGAYAADDAIDRAALVNSMLTELFTGESVLKTGPKLKHVHATDCRSLFGSVIASNPSTEEKRVLLTIRAVQEAIDTKLFRWIPTTQMVADVLTKDSEPLRWAFLQWLRDPVCQLKEPQPD